jgi:hypothetical protein
MWVSEIFTADGLVRGFVLAWKQDVLANYMNIFEISVLKIKMVLVLLW